MEEDKLIILAKSGNLDAINTLLLEYQSKAFSICSKMIGNYDDASDAAQIALIKVFNNINKFRGKSKFSTWVYKIVVNTCLDEIKKKKKIINFSKLSENESDLLDNLKSKEILPEKHFENNDLKSKIRKAILKLCDEQKTVIILREIEGLSYQEIANVLNISEGTVKSRINRARSNLKNELIKTMELF